MASATQLCKAIQQMCEEINIPWSQMHKNDVPKKWEKHGDMILLPGNCFQNKKLWDGIDQEKLWSVVATALKGRRLAKQTAITDDNFRTPKVVILRGDNPLVIHVDNKIKYQFDVTKCMFSSGNITEKMRMAKLNCSEEVVVDMFAGIGYFTLPLLVHAKAKHVHACEWNPDAVKALKANLALNKVSRNCTVHEGDNRKVCPENVADRIILGLIPTAAASYEAACRALSNDRGGVMHIHGNVTSFDLNSDQSADFSCAHNHCSGQERISFANVSCNRVMKPDWLRWAFDTALCLLGIFDKQNNSVTTCAGLWFIDIKHIERVKSYAPHIDHLVADLSCFRKHVK